MEYDMNGSQTLQVAPNNSKLYNTTRLKQREEAVSQYVDEESDGEKKNVTHSLIANNRKNKGLKKRLT